MNKKRRIEIAADTIEILEKGYYTNNKGEKVDLTLIQEKAEDNTRLYEPAGLDNLKGKTDFTNNFQTRYEVNNETTCDAARRLVAEGVEDVLVLNFASAKNPD